MKILLLTILGMYLLSGTLLYFLQEQMIFYGQPLSEDYKYSFDRSFIEQSLETNNGGNINLLHFKADSSKGLIIYFHGNAGNLSRWGYVTEFYVDLGYDVVIMDYRGYGKSTGSVSQKNLLSDAQAVYEKFSSSVPEKKIILYGRSLGTGIAAYLAASNKPGKLILETPYYNFASLAQFHMPIFPARLALKYRFKSNEYVQQVECPIYIFHGTADRVVPYEQGKRLFESMDSEKATMYTIDGGGHNNLIDFKEFRRGMREVLK